ncbi:MAG TPA: hypothetical protein VN426_10895 [Syntrophomonadaceae bacterium]|nr:hypothetical protein [Syntrophomonadaceae bacterium]
MFKRALFGYSKASMIQTKMRIEQQVAEQEKDIEKSLDEAGAEQAQILNELKNATTRLEETRCNTVLAEKFQENIATVIGEVKASLEDINAKKIKESKDFCCEIDEQIAVLDGQIATIKQQIRALVQGLSDVSKSGNSVKADEENFRTGFKNILDGFAVRVEDCEDLAISTEILKFKGWHREEVPFREDKEETVELVVESSPDVNLDFEISSPAEDAMIEGRNDQDENQDRRFFDQMRQSLENSATLYIKLKEEKSIVEIDEEYVQRAQQFLDHMRHYWRSTPLLSTPAAEIVTNQEDEQYAVQAEQFLEGMRAYWRNPVDSSRQELAAVQADEAYLVQAERFLDNMRKYWKG